MSSLYLSKSEIDAIKAIDLRAVEEGVRQSLDEGRASPLSALGLFSSHPYIANELHRFERDLAKYAQAKATAKRERTRSVAWRSGDDLKYAVRTMKDRAEKQEAEVQLFRIDDHIFEPSSFQDRIEVRVGYQWRAAIGAEWQFGNITYFRTVDMRPDFLSPQPTRKLSAPALERQCQDRLYDHWDDLRSRGLQAVQEYFRLGGDGAAIPQAFEAKPGRHDRHLNNFSCDFWRPEDSERREGWPKTSTPIVPPVTRPDTPSDPATQDGALKVEGRVEHMKFGTGTISHIQGNQVTVEFDEAGTKRVMSTFLKPAA